MFLDFPRSAVAQNIFTLLVYHIQGNITNQLKHFTEIYMELLRADQQYETDSLDSISLSSSSMIEQTSGEDYDEYDTEWPWVYSNNQISSASLIPSIEERDVSCVYQAKNGHTVRKNPFHNGSKSEQPRLYRTRGPLRGNPDENSTEIPITQVDEYFDSCFWQSGLDQGYFHYGNENYRTLNTPQRWEEVENLLQSIAIKITKEFYRYEGCIVTHYDVPIIGHHVIGSGNCRAGNIEATAYNGLPIKEQIRRNQPKSWLEWNGKFYDPSYIYQYVTTGGSGKVGSRWIDEDGEEQVQQHGYLKPICENLIQPKREVISKERDSIQRDGSILLGNASSYSLRLNTNRVKMERMKRSSVGKLVGGTGSGTVSESLGGEYVEIDLKNICEITHIGTLGGYPTDTMLFPPIPDRANYGYSQRERKKWRAMHRRHRFVSVVKDPSKLSWVTSYQIHYRDSVTGKWYPYPDTLSGNRDVGTEVFQAVSSIRTRYLRVFPLEFVYAKEMRINVYGKILAHLDKKKNKNTIRNGMENEGAANMGTIRYSLHPAVHSNMRMDGYIGKDHNEYDELHPSRNNRHNKFLQDVKDSDV